MAQGRVACAEIVYGKPDAQRMNRTWWRWRLESSITEDSVISERDRNRQANRSDAICVQVVNHAGVMQLYPR